MMKTLLKILTFPIWLPLKVLWFGAKTIALLLLLILICVLLFVFS